jgi:hypothetical protein
MPFSKCPSGIKAYHLLGKVLPCTSLVTILSQEPGYLAGSSRPVLPALSSLIAEVIPNQYLKLYELYTFEIYMKLRKQRDRHTTNRQKNEECIIILIQENRSVKVVW